jgi:DNA-binding NtrC family response regulator
MSEKQIDKSTVLIVDDDEILRGELAHLLDEEYRTLQAGSRRAALSLLETENVDVVVCDLHLPPSLHGMEEGLAIIEAARARRPPIPVIVITGSEKKRGGLEAVKRGAYGFFEKPFDDEEEVFHLVRQAARMRRLELENERLRAAQNALSPRGINRFIGSHSRFADVLETARKIADTSSTVLITGESGTGKSILARAIHEESARSRAPFVMVSCAALPESLIEAELFGHEKGAFTGAHALKKGRFELADGGTLFLDEIGELSPAMQVKLLSVLQERQFERLGGTKTITVDVRLIAASNRNLESEVAAGRFRRDLFFRLNVIALDLPPLRERRDDIPTLAAHFAAVFAEKHKRPLVVLHPLLIEVLSEYDFPGNVRELENLMERIVLLQRGAQVDPSLLPGELADRLADALSGEDAAAENRADADDPTTFFGALTAFKRQLINDAVRKFAGNRTAAARQLGISRSYLHRLIKELNIDA